MIDFNRLAELENQRSVLEPSDSERRKLTELTTEFGHAFVEGIADQNGYYPGNSTDGLQIPATPVGLEGILKLYRQCVVKQGISPASAGHLGYIPGGGIYASALGDFLAAVTNEYAGVQFASPGAVAIENACLNWVRRVFGFPPASVGNLSSGGSVANLIALTAARDRHGIKGARVAQSVIYTSPHVHHCIQKAVRIIGLEDCLVREIGLDDKYRIVPDMLENQIQLDMEAGLNPFLVIASAGTTDTGAVDPLRAIATICGKHQLWFHVDAAYGGFFILCEETRHLFDGISEADSLVVDPHKGLFLPYGIGAVLVRDREAVMHSNHYLANYMQDAMNEDSDISPADVSPELTKHFRGLRMWLPLMLYGEEPFRAALSEKLILTNYFRELLVQNGFRVGPEPDLSVSYFWWPDETDPDAYNEMLIHEIHQNGRIFLSSSRIGGRFVIRMAILAFRTNRNTVDEAMQMILECKKNLDGNRQSQN